MPVMRAKYTREASIFFAILFNMIFAHAFAGAVAGKYIAAEKDSKKGKFSMLQINIIYLLAIIGSIFPDLDLIYVFLNPTIHHRYLLSHSFLFYTVILIFAWILKKRISFTYMISFYVGVLTHLLLDFITGGIVVFAPLSYTLIGLPMDFVNLTKWEYLSAYFNSMYMAGEIGIFVLYMLYVYKGEASMVAKTLPFVFLVIAYILLLFI